MPELRTPTDARWSCHSCGFCCHLFKLGPVEPEIIAGLQARDIEAHWEPAKKGWFHLELGPDGREHAFLDHKDGACVFLRPDNLCAVHALYGEHAKPGFCREYPYTAIEDPRGVAAVVRPDCGGFHESFRDGTLQREGAPSSVGISRHLPVRRFAPAEVQVLPGLRVPLATWMDWEQDLLLSLDALRQDPPPPEESVALLRRRLFALAGLPEPEPDPAAMLLALRAATHGLCMMMEAMARAPEAESSAYELAFTAEVRAAVERARTRLRDDDALDRPLTEDARRYLNLLLRSAILGKQVHALGGVAEGLGAFLLDTAIARLGPPEELLPDPDEPLSARHLGLVMPRWQKASLHSALQHVLRLARPALQDAFRNASR